MTSLSPDDGRPSRRRAQGASRVAQPEERQTGLEATDAHLRAAALLPGGAIEDEMLDPVDSLAAGHQRGTVPAVAEGQRDASGGGVVVERSAVDLSGAETGEGQVDDGRPHLLADARPLEAAAEPGGRLAHPHP